MRYTFIFLFFISFSFCLKAQYSVDAEIRPRFEHRMGYRNLPIKDTLSANLITQRTRLGLNYKNDKLIFRVSMQDTRTWGEEGIKEDLPSIGLSEGFFTYKINDTFNVTSGRMHFIYDNQRLLSNTNWAQRNLTHDGLLLKYSIHKWHFQSGHAFNQIGDPLFTTDYSAALAKNNYKFLHFIFVEKELGNLFVSPVYIAEGYQRRKTVNVVDYRQTAGFTTKYSLKQHSIILRAYYQFGKDTAGTKINAYYLNPEYSFNQAKFLLSIGAEYISGNDATDTLNRDVHYFSTLYGSGHGFNGHMDYFTDIPRHTKKAGLLNPYIKLQYACNDKLSAYMDVHYFQLANEHLKAGTENKYLATECDLGFKWSLMKEISIQSGLSYLSASSTLQSFFNNRQSTNNAYWGFLMVTVKPK